MATSFNTQGSTPNTNPYLSKNFGAAPGSTPAAKALSSYAAPASVPISPSLGMQTTTPATPKPVDFSQVATASGLIPSSQTHTNVDGSSITTKYQPPQAQPLASDKTQGDSLINNGSAALTPEQIAAKTGQTPQTIQSTQTQPETTGGYSYSNPPTFQGLISQEANMANTINPTTAAAQTALLNQAQSQNPLITQDIAAQQTLASEIGPALSRVTNTPGLLANQNARASNISQAYGQEMQGYGANINALQNEQATQQSGLNQAGSLGTTQQNVQQSGLNSAASAIAPTGNFPFSYDPLTGQFSSGAGGPTGTSGAGSPTLTYNPQNDANTLAAAVIANKVSYSDAVSALGYAGNVGQGLLTTAITAQGGNLANIEAKTSANQQNISTATTAGVNAANTAYSNAVQKVSQATAQYTAASGVAANLTDTLGSWSQTGQLTNINQAINKVASLTSSPQYAQFVAALTNTQAAYTAAFQTAGITPTQSTQNALQELNPNSSAETIVASLNQLSSDLHAATIVPAYQQQQTYGQQLGLQ